MHLTVVTDGGGRERVCVCVCVCVWGQRSTQRRVTFAAKTLGSGSSSERSDRYSEVCQHRGKCAPVGPLRDSQTHTHTHTHTHTGDRGVLNPPPCFSPS